MLAWCYNLRQLEEALSTVLQTEVVVDRVCGRQTRMLGDGRAIGGGDVIASWRQMSTHGCEHRVDSQHCLGFMVGRVDLGYWVTEAWARAHVGRP